MEYIELELQSDWGVPYYGEKGKALRNGFASVRYGFGFKDGDLLEVQFPDGTIENVQIVHRHETTQTSDMGHVSTFRVGYPGFNLKHRGIVAWVPLGDVKPRRDCLKLYSDD